MVCNDTEDKNTHNGLIDVVTFDSSCDGNITTFGFLILYVRNSDLKFITPPLKILLHFSQNNILSVQTSVTSLFDIFAT